MAVQPRQARATRDGIRASMQAFFSRATIRQAFDLAEVFAGTDFVVLWGTERNELFPRGGEPRVVMHRATLVIRRESDGAWRLARGMTNQPPPRTGSWAGTGRPVSYMTVFLGTTMAPRPRRRSNSLNAGTSRSRTTWRRWEIGAQSLRTSAMRS